MNVFRRLLLFPRFLLQFSDRLNSNSSCSGCLRKHQLPAHLRPTISIEQLLSFLCHNSSHYVDTDDQPHKARRLSSFLPTLSITLCTGFVSACKDAMHLLAFTLYPKCQPSFPKREILKWLSFILICVPVDGNSNFNCRLTPAVSRRALPNRQPRPVQHQWLWWLH